MRELTARPLATTLARYTAFDSHLMPLVRIYVNYLVTEAVKLAFAEIHTVKACRSRPQRVYLG